MAAHAPAINAIVAEQQRYASTHDLPGVFECLLVSLLAKKPAQPLTHISETLRHIHESKSFSTDTPGREMDTEEGAQKYLDEQHVNDLLEELLAAVLFQRPAEPLLFLADEAKRLQTSKSVSGGLPSVRLQVVTITTSSICLQSSMYSEADLRAMFSLYDPSGRGVITAAQVANAFRNLGIRTTPSLPAGDSVDVDTFLRVTKEAMQKERGA